MPSSPALKRFGLFFIKQSRAKAAKVAKVEKPFFLRDLRGFRATYAKGLSKFKSRREYSLCRWNGECQVGGVKVGSNIRVASFDSPTQSPCLKTGCHIEKMFPARYRDHREDAHVRAVHYRQPAQWRPWTTWLKCRCVLVWIVTRRLERGCAKILESKRENRWRLAVDLWGCRPHDEIHHLMPDIEWLEYWSGGRFRRSSAHRNHLGQNPVGHLASRGPVRCRFRRV